MEKFTITDFREMLKKGKIQNVDCTCKELDYLTTRISKYDHISTAAFLILGCIMIVPAIFKFDLRIVGIVSIVIGICFIILLVNYIKNKDINEQVMDMYKKYMEYHSNELVNQEASHNH